MKYTKAKRSSYAKLGGGGDVPVPSPFPIEKKVKYKKPSTDVVRLNSDNTSSYTTVPKGSNNPAPDPLTDIINQTVLDQGNFSRGYNIGSELGKKYNNKTLGWINTGLEFVKTKTPMAGDFIANTGQEVISAIDEKMNTNSNESRLADRVKKFAAGGETPRKPIVVNDPNDPRLRAYNDSADAYNFGQATKKRYEQEDLPYSQDFIKGKTLDILFNKEYTDKQKNKPYKGMLPVAAMYVGIKPRTGVWSDRYTDGSRHEEEDVIGTDNISMMSGYRLFKKPVQPYEYQESTTNTTQPKSTNKPVVKPIAKPTAKPKQDYWNTDPDVLAFRKTFKEKYGEEPSRDPKVAKYDYDKAFKSGVKPVMDSTDGLYHWDSRFKHDDHPNLIVDNVNTKTNQPVNTPKATAPNRFYYGKGSRANVPEDVPQGFYTQPQFDKAVQDAIQMRKSKQTLAYGGNVSRKKLPKYSGGGFGLPATQKGIDNINNIGKTATGLSANYTNPSPTVPTQSFNKMGAVGSVAGMGSGLVDMATTSTTTDADGVEYQTQSDLGAFGSGALKGAATGAMLGPWGAAAGAVGYGVAGLMMNDAEQKKIAKAKEASLTRRNEAAYDNAVSNQSNAVAQGFKPSGVQYAGMYKKGGYLKYPDGGSVPAEYEVEGEEVVQGQGTQLEGQENLASDMTKAVGPTHENGGVLGAGGDRVFSDRLYASPALSSALSAMKIKVGKNATYANIAEKLGRYKGKFETKVGSNNSITHKTGQAMTARIDAIIDAAFQDQELQKQNDEDMKTYAKGGKLPKYYKGKDRLNGASIEYDPFPVESVKPVAGEFYNDPNSLDGLEPNQRTTSYEDIYNEGLLPNLNKKKGKTGKYTYIASNDNANKNYTGVNSYLTPEQGINTAVYFANLKNANKQQTGFMPEVAAPAYMRNVNMLPYNKYMLSKEAATMDRSIDMSSSNTQDRFARKMAVRGETMDRINQATATQQQSDMQTANINTDITNRYRANKADAKNKFMEMKVSGENAKLTNRQAATNAWLQGIMGNLASSRAYEVEKEKMQIARMDGGRGTAERSDKSLSFLKNYGIGEKKYGGKLSKKYC